MVTVTERGNLQGFMCPKGRRSPWWYHLLNLSHQKICPKLAETFSSSLVLIISSCKGFRTHWNFMFLGNHFKTHWNFSLWKIFIDGLENTVSWDFFFSIGRPERGVLNDSLWMTYVAFSNNNKIIEIFPNIHFQNAQEPNFFQKAMTFSCIVKPGSPVEGTD